MSKKSDFSKTLDDLDRKVTEIKSQQKVVTEKEKRIQKIVNEQEKKIKELQILEEKVAKKAELQKKIMYMFILSILGIVILVPYYRKDPVNFWMYVIVGVCLVGMWAMRKK
jgi:hypothetical protein